MDSKEKKQLVDRIKKSTNILVTVGTDPSVDALAAALGLTLVLGKLDKHATAVFSGVIPPAISFLEPDKTFEDTVDGLRDFIIALNKDKADHLRYKLDGDVVKIFITPYKNTIIRDTDFEFSQGDFNVELIIALGVANKADLDSAVSAHGRILHDATTITLSAGSDTSTLGEIDWHAEKASSLCEMLVRLANDLGEAQDGSPLLDEHTATALLTGIVANTERFSNNLTTSEVMKTAANLMAAGANQQLIATRLQTAEEREEPAPRPESSPKPEEDDDATIGTDGTMQIKHAAPSKTDAPKRETDRPLHGQSLADIERNKEKVLQDALDRVVPAAHVDLDDLSTEADEEPVSDLVPAPKPVIIQAPAAPAPRFVVKPSGGALDDNGQPSMGGTLNATTEQAEEDARSIADDDRNRVILSHNAPPAKSPADLDGPRVDAVEPSPDLPAPLTSDTPGEVPQKTVKETFEDEPTQETAPKPEPKPAPKPQPAPAPVTPQPSVKQALESLGYAPGSNPTLADLDRSTGHDTHANDSDDDRGGYEAATIPAPVKSSVTPLGVEDARAAVASALDSSFSPANNPMRGIGAQPLGDPTHDVPASPLQAPVSATAIDLPPLPPLPPLPGTSGGLPPLPPLPNMGPTQSSVLDIHDDGPAPAAGPTNNDWQSHTVEPPASNDPGQFRIPGQK